MSMITTHVLDTAHGKPAQGVPVKLEVLSAAHTWKTIAEGVTNDDGRVSDLLKDGHKLEAGVYKITFNTGAYFEAAGVEGFYPEAGIVFQVRDPGQHYHIPLLLNPFGYSTYRGS